MNDLSYNNNYVFYNAGDNGSGITVNIGANVTKIPAYLFYPYDYSSYSPKITSVIFAENSQCKSIGSRAFYRCSSLESIEIPSSVISIGGSAFLDCSAVGSITVEEGNTVYHSEGNCLIETASKTLVRGCNNSVIPTDGSVTSIGSGAFSDCRLLQSIEIPSDVTSIGSQAFDGCSSLQSIEIPSGVTSIGNYAFCDCSSLQSIEIPSGVTSIDNYAFSDCTSLESIEIPSGVTSIGSSAFSNCTALTEINFNATAMNDLSSSNFVFYNAGKNGSGITVNIGANVTKIPAYLFNPYSSSSYSPNITSVIFAENSQCKSIGNSAFEYCSSLQSIEIPSGVTSIGNYAFDYCTGLESVTFGENSLLESIGTNAFRYCDYLTIYCYQNSVPHTYAVDNDISYVLLDGHTCLDEDNNHKCDLCAVRLTALCKDENNDHKCDICGEAFGQYEDGFVVIDGDTYYYVNNNYVTGYYIINNKIYFFGDDGKMTTDGVNNFHADGYIIGNNIIVTVNGSKYCLVNNTIITNYYIINNHIYYFGDDGKMTDDGENEFSPDGYIEGDEVFIKINNDTYYIVNNTIITNYYIINNYIYYFGDDGKMTGDGKNDFHDNGYIEGDKVFIEINNDTYYIVNNTIIKNYYIVNNHIYYFGDDGKMTGDGKNDFHDNGYIEGDKVFIKINNDTYYIVNNTIITNYYIINNYIYYFGDDGKMTDDGENDFTSDGYIEGDKVFIEINNDTYYIVNNTIITNYYIINNYIYYFGDDGKMTEDGENDFTSDGYIEGDKVFIKIEGDTYYVVNNTIITNYYIINNYIYYFGDDGKMTDDGENEFSPDGYIKGDKVFIEINNDTYYIVNNTIITNYYIINNYIYYFGDDGKMTDDGKNNFHDNGYIEGDKVFIKINNDTYYIVNNTIITNYYIINNYIYYFGDDGKMTDDGKNEFSPDGYIEGDKVFIKIEGDTYYIVNNTIIKNYYIVNNHIYYFGDDGKMTDDGENNFHDNGYIEGDKVFIKIEGDTYYIVNNTIITNYYIINNYIYYFRDDGKMTGDGKNEFSPDGYIKGDNEFVNVDGNNYYLVNDRVTEYVGDYDCSTMGHMYGDWSETKKATCTEKGSESRTCEHCDYTETRDIDALGHDFSEPTVTKEATCTENGTRTSSCSRCDETLTTEIDALGHDFELVIDQEPTETEDGKKVWECTRCDETKTEIIPSVNKPSDSESGDTETDGTTDTDKVPVTDSTTVTDGTTSNGDTTSADGTASADGTSADGSSSSTDTTPDVTSGSDSSDALGTDSSDIGGNDKDNDNSSAVWVIFAIVGAVICAALIAAVALSKGKAKADK